MDDADEGLPGSSPIPSAVTPTPESAAAPEVDSVAPSDSGAPTATTIGTSPTARRHGLDEAPDLDDGGVRSPDTPDQPAAGVAGPHPILALLGSIGGPAAIVDSAAPTIVFALTYTLNHRHLRAAVLAAVGIAAVLAIWRLVRRQPLQTVLGGFLGIALAAGIAEFTGRASDYYLVSIVRSLGLALVYAVSALIRWPVVGVLVGAAAGRPGAFRDDPEQLRAYTRVTWFWVLLFGVRLAVRGPLLLANKFGWLSVTDVVMGWPLFAVWVALTYVLLRRWLHGSVWQAAHEGIVGRNARAAARRDSARRPRDHGAER